MYAESPVPNNPSAALPGNPNAEPNQPLQIDASFLIVGMRKSLFFVAQANGSYQISNTMRKLCVFVRHNLASDPPFSNLDLISCRNLLIYLSNRLQERIMALFHYSLNLTGSMVLGTSESVKAASKLFAPVDEGCKIHSRKRKALLSRLRGRNLGPAFIPTARPAAVKAARVIINGF
jgi:CheR methyltransferase, SAM binding domain